jgi:AraC-like DNA-binding protein
MDRLEAMLQHLQNLEEKDIDWVDVANLFGFSDQSHLIRYLKTNIGKTPVKYVQQRDLAIDIYGDFEGS